MQADQKKFHIQRILYNCKGCINTPGCSAVYKSTTEQEVQHSLTTHRQAVNIPFKCSAEECLFATNNFGKVKSHLQIAHKIKTKNEDDARGHYTGTGINIPSQDLTELIPETEQGEGHGSWKTVTHDKEVQEVRARQHSNNISQTFRKGPNERKGITITAYQQRKGKVQYEIKIHEATESKDRNGDQEVEEQEIVAQGTPSK